MADLANDAAGRSPLPWRKILFGALLFLGLTAGVFWYQFANIDDGSAGPTWSGLRWDFALVIVLALPLDPLATTARMWLVGRVLHPDIRFWTCFKADCANVAVSMLTPSQSGGGPAQVYMLSRDRVPVGTALAVSMLSFLGTLIGLSVIGSYSLLASTQEIVTRPLFAAAVWAVTLLVVVMVASALAPSLFRAPIAMLSRGFARLTGRADRPADWRPPDAAPGSPPVDVMGRYAAKLSDVLYTYSRDVTRFFKQGKLAFLGAIAGTLGFLFARGLLAYLSVRFFGIEASFVQVLEIQMAVVFVVYFSPTPGAAGIAESVSMIAMGAIVPLGVAPYYNLLWRFSTIYFWALAGMLFLARAIARAARPDSRASHELR